MCVCVVLVVVAAQPSQAAKCLQKQCPAHKNNKCVTQLGVCECLCMCVSLSNLCHTHTHTHACMHAILTQIKNANRRFLANSFDSQFDC